MHTFQINTFIRFFSIFDLFYMFLIPQFLPQADGCEHSLYTVCLHAEITIQAFHKIIIIIIIIISNLSYDRSKAFSKTIPPHSAI